MPLHCKRYINHSSKQKNQEKSVEKKSKIKAIKAKIPLLKASWHDDLLLLYWAATGKSSGKNGRHRSVIFGWCWRSDGQIDVSGDRRRTTSSSTCRPNTSQTPGKMRAERTCESRLAAQSKHHASATATAFSRSVDQGASRNRHATHSVYWKG